MFAPCGFSNCGKWTVWRCARCRAPYCCTSHQRLDRWLHDLVCIPWRWLNGPNAIVDVVDDAVQSIQSRKEKFIAFISEHNTAARRAFAKEQTPRKGDLLKAFCFVHKLWTKKLSAKDDTGHAVLTELFKELIHKGLDVTRRQAKIWFPGTVRVPIWCALYDGSPCFQILDSMKTHPQMLHAMLDTDCFLLDGKTNEDGVSIWTDILFELPLLKRHIASRLLKLVPMDDLINPIGREHAAINEILWLHPEYALEILLERSGLDGTGVPWNSVKFSPFTETFERREDTTCQRFHVRATLILLHFKSIRRYRANVCKMLEIGSWWPKGVGKMMSTLLYPNNDAYDKESMERCICDPFLTVGQCKSSAKWIGDLWKIPTRISWP